MMILSRNSKPAKPSNVSDAQLEQVPVRYKGWGISTKVISGKLWLRWQHPQEKFPRYGCPVGEEGIEATIIHVRFLIDLAIKLEKETQNKGIRRS